MNRHNEGCEPCGECEWCEENFKAHRDVKELRAALRRALHQVDRLARQVEGEAQALAGDEESNPFEQGARALARRARKVAARLEPLTRARSTKGRAP